MMVDYKQMEGITLNDSAVAQRGHGFRRLMHSQLRWLLIGGALGSSKLAKLLCCLTGLLLMSFYMLHKNAPLLGYQMHRIQQSMPTPEQHGVTLGFQLRGRLDSQNESLIEYQTQQIERSSPTPKQHGGTLGLQLRGRLDNQNESLLGYREHQMVQPTPTPKQRAGALGLKLRGRLGNQMFQYASLLGLASMMNFERVFIEGGQQLKDTFKLGNDRVEFRKVPPHWKVVKSTLSGMFDETLTQLNNTSELQIEAYLESWKYFLKIESIIEKDFTFKSHVMSTAKNLLDAIIVKQKLNISFTNVTYVGVHIRRGDYLSVASVQKGYNVAPMEYVLKAMGIMHTIYGPDIIFIICSDDIQLVKKAISVHGPLSSYSFMFMENSPPVDLAVLSLCNHTIATTGTFSWWAAWLAGGTTFFYKHQARLGSDFRRRINYDDFFCPHWILLE